VAKSELGTKRVCPETGRKFYDLNRDPIVSPYTGVSYPRSYFETGSESSFEEEETEEELETTTEKAELVPLEEADKDGDSADEDLADIDSDDVDIDSDDDSAPFLEDEEEEDGDDVTGIIGGGRGDDDDES
jgi:uncharacterized protein (TIGR02300 family)